MNGRVLVVDSELAFLKAGGCSAHRISDSAEDREGQRQPHLHASHVHKSLLSPYSSQPSTVLFATEGTRVEATKANVAAEAMDLTDKYSISIESPEIWDDRDVEFCGFLRRGYGALITGIFRLVPWTDVFYQPTTWCIFGGWQARDNEH